MLIPDRALLLAGGAWLLLAVLVAWQPALLGIWWTAGAAWITLAVIDAIVGRRQRGKVAVLRVVSLAMPVGTWQTVGLRLSSETPRASGWIMDQVPVAFASEGLPLRFHLAPGQGLRADYRVAVRERGRQIFSGVTLRHHSPWRFWWVQEALPVRSEVRVFPNFARIAQYTLLATDNRLSQLGILRRRRRGEGMEFHQLRDYREDDSPRQIDWKASSRVGRLIARDHEDERDQQLVFLLDCSARMRAKDGELSHFDHTLDALLLLAYVALRQGDAIGLATFGHASPRMLLPGKSVATVNALMKVVYDLEPSLQAPDYLAAAELLSRHLRKRALVILVTNLRDEDDDTLLPAVRLLQRRHALTVASLREPVLDELLAAPVGDFEAALTRSAAIEYLHARRRQIAALTHGGVQVVDVGPRQLPIALINHYWFRKRAGTL